MRNLDNPLNLREKLRASTVKRWHIINTSRQQSVAEHSFNMCLFIEEICSLCSYPELVSEAIQYAIHHDIPEVVLGDIPSSIKMLYAINDKSASLKLDPLSIPPRNKLIAEIVKLADLLDAVVFLQLYGIDRYSRDVRLKIVEQIYNLDIVLYSLDEFRSFVNNVVSWETSIDSGFINE